MAKGYSGGLTVGLTGKAGSVVFVQQQPDKLEFSLRAVEVVYRFKDMVYVRSVVAGEAEERRPDGLPVQGLKVGDRVVTESVVELTKALRDLLAK